MRKFTEKKLEKMLKKARRSVRISPFFKVKTWWKLQRRYKKLYGHHHGFFTIQKTIAMGFASIFIFTSATGAYAYTSPSVTDGTVLYPVKRVIEKAEERFQKTDEERAEFHAKMMDRRIAEAEILERRGKKNVETLDEMSNNFYEIVRRANRLEEVKRDKMLEKINFKLRERERERVKAEKLRMKIMGHREFVEMELGKREKAGPGEVQGKMREEPKETLPLRAPIIEPAPYRPEANNGQTTATIRIMSPEEAEAERNAAIDKETERRIQEEIYREILRTQPEEPVTAEPTTRRTAVPAPVPYTREP
jgi:hypothetical protein